MTIAPLRVVGFLMAASLTLSAQPSRVGDVSFANSGAPAAQAAFVHGLAQLHNFEYDDAARAFRDAQRQDPGFALAYWGEAMTRNHPVWMEQDLGGARRILERLGPDPAARIAKGATDRERAYLRAIESLFGAGAKPARDIAYLDEMRRLHAAYPDDIDATAFLGLAILGSAHEGRDAAIYGEAARVLQSAFAAHPNHPGLAHYLIHAYDDPAHASLGLPAARRYSQIAPAAPHALHMTTHIYIALGMWDEVVAQNERALAVVADRARDGGRRPASCGHYNAWLEYGYLQQGRNVEARRILESCRSAAVGSDGLAPRSPEEDLLDPDNTPAGSYIQMWARYLIDTGDWDDPVAVDEIPLGDLAGPRLTRVYVRAMRAAQRRDVGGLRNELTELERARQSLLTTIAAGGEGAEQYRRRAGVIVLEIRGLLALAEQRENQAVELLTQAAEEEQAMPVEFGPPFVDKPSVELLGDTLIRIGRKAEASAAYTKALARTPGRGAAIRGLERAKP
jgi:tetratricopeptide (TPR) repeat protein